MKKIYIVAILCALALPARAQTLYHVDSSDNVGEMLVNAVGSSQAAPYWIRITKNTGGYFARIGVPLLIVLRQIGYDSSFYQPFELDSVSQIVGDSLYVAKRVLSNSQKLYWPPGTLVEVVNNDGIIIKQLQQRIAAFGIKLPDTVGKAGRFLQDSANGYGLVWSTITGGSSGVSSFNARTGGVVPTSGDYSFSQISGTNGVTKGGTGLTGIGAGLMLYGSATNTLASLIVGNGLSIENDSLVTTSLPIPSFGGDSNFVLSNDGTSLVWSSAGTGTVTNVNVSGGTTGLTTINGPVTNYGTITLGGTLNIANGGTGANTAYQGLINLLPSTIGHVGEVLAISPVDSSVIWDTVGGLGTVTAVNVSGGSTGLTTSGGPVTSAGTITLSGTLAIGHGGTGQTTANAALNALLPTQSGHSGDVLTSGGTNATWVTPTTGANPTATIGTSAVNGTATTFMRSDAAPAFGNLTGDVTSVGMATSIASGSIGNAKLTNSSITVTAGTGLSGGGSVSLGSTVTLSVGSPNVVTAIPSNPTGTSSATVVMMGLNQTFTPTTSGTVEFLISGNINSGVTGSPTTQIFYGTGTPPTNGAAVTGVSIGGKAVLTGLASGKDFVTMIGLVQGLSTSTVYWWDVGMSVGGTASSSSFTDVYMQAKEIK